MGLIAEYLGSLSAFGTSVTSPRSEHVGCIPVLSMALNASASCGCRARAALNSAGRHPQAPAVPFAEETASVTSAAVMGSAVAVVGFGRFCSSRDSKRGRRCSIRVQTFAQ